VSAPRGAVAQARAALGDRRATFDVPWVADLTGLPAARVRALESELPLLLPMERRIHAAHRAAGRASYAQIRAPFELYALVRLLRPDHVVETGVSSGVSSAHLLAGLRRNRHGRLHSIDRPTRQRGRVLAPDESPVSLPPHRNSGWSVPDGLRHNWDLRIGPARRRLPALVRSLPSIGLFLHDSLHTPAHLAFELATIRPLLRPGSVVLADNTSWTGAAFPRFARTLGAPVHRHGRTDLVGLCVPETAAGTRR
jgi:hypothetical protein